MFLSIDNLVLNAPSGQTLLSDASATIAPGVTALTGGNGAGKSTLLKTIATLYKAEKGAISFDGIDNVKQKKLFLSQLTYMPQNFSAYPALTGLEFLTYFLRLKGQSNKQAKQIAQAWLDVVGLTESENQRTQTYSQGMLQRLGFAFSMQVDTPLCIMDEPFAGVDPDSREQLLNLLFAKECANRTVLICTHHVDEIIARDANQLNLAQRTLQA